MCLDLEAQTVVLVMRSVVQPELVVDVEMPPSGSAGHQNFVA